MSVSVHSYKICVSGGSGFFKYLLILRCIFLGACVVLGNGGKKITFVFKI